MGKLRVEAQSAAGEQGQAPAQESGAQSDQNKPRPEIIDATVKIEESDALEIGVTDPMDYVMGKGTSKIRTQEDQEVTKEPAENEVTLYRDNKMKLTVTDSPEKKEVTIETLKDGTKVTAESSESLDDTIKVSDHFEDYEVEPEPDNSPEEVQSEPPRTIAQAFSNQRPEAPSSEPEIAHEMAEPEEAGEPVEVPQNLKEVVHSKGVIYLSGKDLKLTGGLRIDPGDQIIIKDKLFEVKIEPKKNYGMIAAISGTAFLVILGIILMTGIFSRDIGQLAGMVRGIDGRALAGVSVRLVEQNKSAKTNEAGFFAFEGVPSGIHTIEYQTSSGVNAQDRVTVLKNRVSTVALSEPVHRAEQQADLSESTGQRSSRSESTTPSRQFQPEENNSDVSPSGKGFLKLTLSPNNSSIYLDGKPIGIGSNTYKVASGSHDLEIRKEGYQNYSSTIDIESDKTHPIKVTLKESDTDKSRETSTPKKSALELAVDKERAGNYREALRLYDQALDRNPREVDAILGKARCYRADGLAEKAVSFYQHAAKIASGKNDMKSQIEALTGVIELRPNTFTAYSARGDIRYTLGQYDRAIDDYSKVVELDKKNLTAYYKLGNSFYKSQKYHDAVGAFLAAEEINFADPKAQAYLAKTYYKLGDKKNTKKAYERFKDLASYSTRLEFKKDAEWQEVLASLGATD
jgi:tetratricopeptide (TPR) repeat protein